MQFQMEQAYEGFQEDFINIQLDILAVKERLISVSRTNRCVQDVMPKALATFEKVVLVTDKINGRLATLMKGVYDCVALTLNRLTQKAEEPPCLKKAEKSQSLRPQLLTIQQQREKELGTWQIPKNINLIQTVLELQESTHDTLLSGNEGSSYLAHLNLARYSPNDTKIRKEMEDFIKCVNNIEQNSENFLRGIHLSQQVPLLSVESVGGIIQQSRIHREDCFKQMEDQYQLLLGYFKALLKEHEHLKESFSKEKESLLNLIYKQTNNTHTLSKRAMIKSRKIQVFTQTPLTCHQLSLLQQEILQKLHQIKNKDVHAKTIMQEVYQLRIIADEQNLRRESDGNIITENAKLIECLRDNILKICEYTAEVEGGHFDLNEKIEQISMLGLEEFVDEKEFNSFSMSFKVSLFNIFRRIVAKYAKANDESKKVLEGIGRRGAICQLKTNNFMRKSKRLERRNQEGTSLPCDSPPIQPHDLNNGCQSPDDELEKEHTLLPIENSSQDRKKSFVSSIFKQGNMSFVENATPPAGVEKGDPGKGVSRRGAKRVTKTSFIRMGNTLDWNIDEKSNKDINRMLQESLISKFEVVEKSIQAMNIQLLQMPPVQNEETGLKEGGVSTKKTVNRTDPDDHSIRALIEDQKVVSQNTNKNTNSNRWGLRKAVKNMMVKQAEGEEIFDKTKEADKEIKSISRRAGSNRTEYLTGSKSLVRLSSTQNPRPSKVKQFEGKTGYSSRFVIPQAPNLTPSNENQGQPQHADHADTNQTKMQFQQHLYNQLQSNNPGKPTLGFNDDFEDRFSSFYKQSQHQTHRYSNSDKAASSGRKSSFAKKSLGLQQLTKLKQQELRNNRLFVSELKLMYDESNHIFNRRLRQSPDLQVLIHDAEKLHLQKCGSAFCTHLLRFYETLRRLTGFKPMRSQMRTSTFKIDTIRKEDVRAQRRKSGRESH